MKPTTLLTIGELFTNDELEKLSNCSFVTFAFHDKLNDLTLEHMKQICACLYSDKGVFYISDLPNLIIRIQALLIMSK